MGTDLMDRDSGGAPEPCELLITCDYALLPEMKLATDIGIAVQDGRIVGLAPLAEIRQRFAPAVTVEGKGKVALPGFVDAHTHAAQQLLRGRIVDQLPMVWARILVPYESALTAEEVYAGARLCCIELLRNGFTAFAEAGGPHADQIARAAAECGLRACITRSTMDCGAFVPPTMLDTVDGAIGKTEALYEAWNGAANGRVRIWFSIRQVMTATPELILATAERANALGTGLHLHLAEYPAEINHCLVNYQRRPAEWLNDLGILNANVLAAHAIRLTDREAIMLAETGARVVHCPPTNLSNNGFGKTPLLQALGAPVGLGSDGAAHYGADPFRLMRLLKYSVQAAHGLPVDDPVALSVVDALRMATQGGASALMMEQEIGSLAVGKRADVVLLAWQQPHLWPTHDLLEALVLAGRGSDVRDVIVDGQILLRDGQFLHLDEQAIMAEAERCLQVIATRG